MAPDGERSEGPAGTPRGELARLRTLREGQESRQRARIMEAMLEACGEHGYRKASVRNAIDGCGGNRYQFYAHFSSKADCYAAAYETEVERRCAALMEAAREEDSWAEGLVTGLRAFAELLEARPALARGLLVEVHVAGGRALKKRCEVVERLAHALDHAREVPGAREDVPSMTATFMIGAVEAFITSVLQREAPHEFGEGLRELAEMILTAYFGHESAAEQLDLLTVA